MTTKREQITAIQDKLAKLTALGSLILFTKRADYSARIRELSVECSSKEKDSWTHDELDAFIKKMTEIEEWVNEHTPQMIVNKMRNMFQPKPSTNP
jgi:hypothetical protein